MISKKIVAGRTIELRSDHLLAVINYACEQAATSGIEVLNFSDNEQGLSGDEQLEALEQMQAALNQLLVNGHQDLIIVAGDDDELTAYRNSFATNGK